MNEQDKPQLETLKARISSHLVAPLGAAMIELPAFHAWDTAAKRLQGNLSRIGNPLVPANRMLLKNVLFPGATGFRACLTSAYQALPQALAYRMCQRVVVFGGQPIASPWVKTHFGVVIEQSVGKKMKTPCESAIAGSLVSIIESCLYPLDTAKVMKQTGSTNSEIWQAIRPRNRKAYRGFSIMTVRNLLAASSLFFGASYAKERLFALDDFQNATLMQDYAAASIGATAAAIISNPLDVIKTGIQKSGGEKTGRDIAREVVNSKGFRGFAGGLFPRLVTSAPRWAFAMTATAQIRHWLTK